MTNVHSKYDNMYKNEIFHALICINNHIISCLNFMLSDTKDILWMDDHAFIMSCKSLAIGSLKCHILDTT